MIELNEMELHQVAAGFKLNTGQAIAAMALGFVTGGPVGLGYAVSVVLIAQGVNNLDEMVHNPDPNQMFYVGTMRGH